METMVPNFGRNEPDWLWNTKKMTRESNGVVGTGTNTGISTPALFCLAFTKPHGMQCVPVHQDHNRCLSLTVSGIEKCPQHRAVSLGPSAPYQSWCWLQGRGKKMGIVAFLARLSAHPVTSVYGNLQRLSFCYSIGYGLDENNETGGCEKRDPTM